MSLARRLSALALLVPALAVVLAVPLSAQFSVRHPTDTFRALHVTHELTTAAGVGAVNGTGVAVDESLNTAYRTTFTFTAHSITMTDATTAGSHGSTKIYDWPAGAIQVLGSSCDLTTLAGAGGLTDTSAVVLALGSVTAGTDNATLTSTEADVIASYAGTLTDGAGVFTKYASLVAAAFDGTTTPKDLYLNVATPDAGSTANDTLTVAGTCTVAWSNLGDF